MTYCSKAGHNYWFKSLLKLRDFVLSRVSAAELQELSALDSKARIHKLCDIFWANNVVLLVPWACLVWNKYPQPRISFWSWLISLDTLPSKSRLFKWRLVNDTLCVFCQDKDETRYHVFGDCPVSIPILSKILHIINICHVPCKFEP